MALELFIRIDENGNCVNHPYIADNLRDCAIDPDGHPDYEPFVRVEFADSGVVPNLLQKPVVSYQKVNGVWTDVWSAEDLTGDELTAMQAEIAADVANFINTRVEQATELMNAATTDADKQVYQNFITTVQNFAITDFNIPWTSINWPQLPKKDENGNWVS
jgi:hypothetical protein